MSNETAMLADDHHTRADSVLLQRALKSRWPISDELRGRLIDRLDGLLESGSERVSVQAAKTICQADALSMQQERLYFDVVHQQETQRDDPTIAKVILLPEAQLTVDTVDQAELYADPNVPVYEGHRATD